LEAFDFKQIYKAYPMKTVFIIHSNSLTMKNKIKFYSLFFLLFPIIVNAQEIKIAYDYPVKPGTEAWKQLESNTQMIEVCQVPEDILNSLSTDALVETCFNHPLIVNVLLDDKLEKNLNHAISRYNSFNALVNRNDAGKALFKVYKEMDVDEFESSGYNTINQSKYRFVFIELFLANNKIINSLNEQEQKELVEEVLKKTLKKQQKGNYVPGQINSGLNVLLKILVHNETINPDDPKIKIFKENISNIDNQTLNYLNIKSNEFTTSSITLFDITDYGIPPTYVTRYTPRGTPITAKIINEEWYNIELANHFYVNTIYHRAELISDATMKYNCHSYALHRTEGNWYDIVWIDDPTAYYTDNSYIKVNSNYSASNLKVIYFDRYGEISHTAIKENNQSLLVSKWGDYGLYMHSETNCPYSDMQNPDNEYYVSTKMDGSTSVTKGQYYYYSVENISGGTYSWTVSNHFQIVSNNGYMIKVKALSSGRGWVNVLIKTFTPLENRVSTKKYITIEDGVNPGLTAFNVNISPNPANEYIYIDLQLKEEFNFLENIELDYDLLLFDKNNNLIRKIKSKQKKVQIDIKNLKKDIYFIQLIQDEDKITKQIIVN